MAQNSAFTWKNEEKKFLVAPTLGLGKYATDTAPHSFFFCCRIFFFALKEWSISISKQILQHEESHLFWRWYNGLLVRSGDEFSKYKESLSCWAHTNLSPVSYSLCSLGWLDNSITQWTLNWSEMKFNHRIYLIIPMVKINEF